MSETTIERVDPAAPVTKQEPVAVAAIIRSVLTVAVTLGLFGAADINVDGATQALGAAVYVVLELVTAARTRAKVAPVAA